jgi:hypothetical protein
MPPSREMLRRLRCAYCIGKKHLVYLHIFTTSAAFLMNSMENEIKYTVSNHKSQQVIQWLSSRCKADKSYHTQTVSSIYYDTLGWKSLNEKVNSDYLKTKVRLRWYSDIAYRHHSESSFAEAKFRIGTKRDKVRIPTPYSGTRIANTALHDAMFSKIPSLLESNNIILRENYFPAYQISYKRIRYKEPLTGATICFDYDIWVSRANSFMLPHRFPLTLQTAVLELKGDVNEMPAPLLGLVQLGCRKESFSKYYGCYKKIVTLTT